MSPLHFVLIAPTPTLPGLAADEASWGRTAATLGAALHRARTVVDAREVLQRMASHDEPVFVVAAGHGAGDALVLDDGAVALPALAGALGDRAPVTWLLDVCLRSPAVRLRDVVVAADAGGQAWATPAGGLLSQAVQAVLARYAAYGSPTSLTASELVERVERVLRALDVDQRPTLSGPGPLQHAPALRPDLASPGAPRELELREIDPGEIFAIYQVVPDANPNTVLAVVVCVGGTNYTDGNANTWTANTAYWFVSTEPFGSGATLRWQYTTSVAITGYTPGSETRSYANQAFPASSAVSLAATPGNLYQVEVVAAATTSIGWVRVVVGQTMTWYKSGAGAWMTALNTAVYTRWTKVATDPGTQTVAVLVEAPL